ncbi:MAG: hydrogenase maturation protease [Candidatus Sumerlaeaceae bacterium]|nr:hydrogenase maturation protease [Candidatus Sumerlaeaceae bacterium]
MAPRVLVVGYGNPLRGDDRVGWVVAARLGEILGEELCAVRTVQQLLPELAEELTHYDVVVYVDACANDEPGGVRIRELVTPQCGSQAPSTSSGVGRGSFTHHVGPRELLALCHALYGRVPRAFLVTIGGADFGFTEQLSPCAQHAAAQAVISLTALLQLEVSGKLAIKRGHRAAAQG